MSVVLRELRKAPAPRLIPIPWSQIHRLPKRESLINGVLDRRGMSLLFGASGCGKTFFGLTIAAHIALGRGFYGLQVCRGGVLYIAAEGGLGIEERLTAFRYHQDVHVDGVPLYVIPEPIDLCHSDTDLKILLQHIGELPADPPLELVVIDTLSRAMAGGNENSSDDMGRFVRHCDQLRIKTGAHTLISHHAGKDDSRGARGHSLLKAAADTEIEITKGKDTGIAIATVVKQRDHRTGGAFAFKLEEVEIGQDEDGRAITSCAVVPVEGDFHKPRRKITGATKVALDLLRRATADAGEPVPAGNHVPVGVRGVRTSLWRRYCYQGTVTDSEDPDAKRKAFHRACTKLREIEVVGVWDDWVWIVEPGDGTNVS
jgi:hypothetical protein